MAETITVQIHGSEYILRGEDAARVREVAEMVNEQMRFVASKAPTQTSTTIAVLAALNTAELLKSERERSQRESTELIRRIDALTSSLREILDLEVQEVSAPVQSSGG